MFKMLYCIEMSAIALMREIFSGKQNIIFKMLYLCNKSFKYCVTVKIILYK